MALSSMTGFARLAGEHAGNRWSWEIKSVNARGLELRFRLPNGFDELELVLRKTLQKKFARGSVNVSLSYRAEQSENQVQINEAALANAASMVERVIEVTGCAPAQADAILTMRGVVETVEEFDAPLDPALQKELLSTFNELTDQLAKSRAQEGEQLTENLSGLVAHADELREQAEALSAEALQALHSKLKEQVDDLLDGHSELAPERLAQEVAVLAVKADIREELDRLAAHLKTAKGYLSDDGAIGRSIDFLTQELNREANTICSKTPSLALKNVGLELKKVIDQIREQIQNVE